jgi:hypothetical protein
MSAPLVSGAPYRDLDAALQAFREQGGELHRPRTAAELAAWADALLACELARCRSCMTPQQWREHREWIEENARSSLLAALYERADRGLL